MKCSRCQAENDPGARFCEDCGARLEAACPSCGTPVTPGKKFCRSCGSALTTEPAGRFASPESYTPRHLAEKILTSKSALEGERKQVTVLFADLKGSMELLADRDPEEARKILDPVLERMMEAVHRYEGTVNQVMGDGIMALFGAPLAHEDHAVRACYAALRMQESVKRYGDGVRRVEGVPIRIRVGLNSGDVVVRAIRSDLHMDYSAVGQTTHIAARMEQIAAPETVTLTPTTLALAEGFVEVKSLGPTPVKGLTEPLEVFELMRATAVRSRLQALAARGLTKFVGRSMEMAQLHQALDLVRRGRGQVVAVVGEPGVGKSRLLWEFAHSHPKTEGCLMIEAASVSYGKATAYLPVIQLLRTYFLIEPRDDSRRIREKVTGRLLSLDPALEPSLSPLLSLLDVPVEDAVWKSLDALQRRHRILDSVKRVLLRESQVQPVTVVFEDLHWIDGETQAFLDSLVESLPVTRLLLLANYRPEYQHVWGGKTYYRQLRIDPLPASNAEELLDELLGRGSDVDALKRLLLERTEGNPFFIEETVRTLVETAAIIGERGAYRLVAPVNTLSVPASAQAILAARIDRLGPADKRRLQAAAVVGKDVPLALLQAIADEGEDELRAGIAVLQAAEFLYEARLFPELEYTFKHALTHEVAYRGLLESQRQAWHVRILAAIEALYKGDRLEEHVDSLAEHAFRGANWEKALDYLHRAAMKAYARSALREAVALFERALLAAERLSERPDVVETAIDLRVAIRNCLVQLGELPSVLPHLREAERLAKALGDTRRITQVSTVLTNYLVLTGQLAEASVTSRVALEGATALNNRDVLIMMNTHLGQFHFAVGNYRDARRYYEENLSTLLPEESDQFFGLSVPPTTMCRGFLAVVLAELGLFDDAVRVAEEAMRLAEAADRNLDRTYALRGMSYALVRQGAFGAALPNLEQGLALCREGTPILIDSFLAFLAYIYLISGRSREVYPLLDEALKRFDSAGTAQPQLVADLWAGDCLLLMGRFNEADDLAHRGLGIARRQGAGGFEAWALRLLGEVACCQVDVLDADSGERYFQSALQLAEPRGMRPLVAHCHLGLGKLYRRTGKREQAHEHLTTATTMYREMDMRFWLEQAQVN